jgi:hypothetical protein
MTRWIRHIASAGEMKNTYTVFVQKPEEKLNT